MLPWGMDFRRSSLHGETFLEQVYGNVINVLVIFPKLAFPAIGVGIRVPIFTWTVEVEGVVDEKSNRPSGNPSPPVPVQFRYSVLYIVILTRKDIIELRGVWIMARSVMLGQTFVAGDDQFMDEV